MAKEIDVKITDHIDELEGALPDAIHRALVAIGMTAETYAKADPDMPVVTGRARNSITFAVAGYQANAKTYTADKPESGQTIPYTGRYEGTMEGNKNEFVAIGSNVVYFPLIENGSSKRRARHVLRRAATDHSEEYKALLKQSLENA